MIRKTVIPAAGLGTRLLPATKEVPKEMLPIFAPDNKGIVCVKPLLQAVFEQFYSVGVREFCFIVGRGKGNVSDHFTSDNRYLDGLGSKELVQEITNFYEMLKSSSIVFISQPELRGFGDAVLRAEPYVNEPFLVQAGDTFILSQGNRHLNRLIKEHEKQDAEATFFVKRVENPKSFGIVEGQIIEDKVYEVTNIVEKPSKPASDLASTAVYIFTPEIFKGLKTSSQGWGGELQLTDGIQKMVNSGLKVVAVELESDEVWLDISNPLSYWQALKTSFEFFKKDTAY